MQCIRLRPVRLLLSGALLSLSMTAGAQRATFVLDGGPWTYTTFEQGTRIRVSIITRDLAHPWSMVFLPATTGDAETMANALIAEREGRVRLFKER